MKRIRISFNSLGEGMMECVGFRTVRCLGMKGLKYPLDLTINPAIRGTKENPHYSRTYSCPPNDNAAGQCIMPYSILIWGQEGVFIHEWPTPATYAGNGGPTHGCIHLDPGNAQAVYNWVDQKTRVTMTYPW